MHSLHEGRKSSSVCSFSFLYLPEPDPNAALEQRLSTLPLLIGAETASDEGVGPSHGLVVNLHECPHSRRLAVGALIREEEPGVLVGDPRNRELELLCAKLLHKTSMTCLSFCKPAVFIFFKSL